MLTRVDKKETPVFYTSRAIKGMSNCQSFVLMLLTERAFVAVCWLMGCFYSRSDFKTCAKAFLIALLRVSQSATSMSQLRLWWWTLLTEPFLSLSPLLLVLPSHSDDTRPGAVKCAVPIACMPPW